VMLFIVLLGNNPNAANKICGGSRRTLPLDESTDCPPPPIRYFEPRCAVGDE